MNGKELAKECSNAVNIIGFNSKQFCDAMSKEHRTIQQNFTRLCFDWISQCAELNFDARNEDSVKACQKLKEVIEKEDICLPYI